MHKGVRKLINALVWLINQLIKAIGKIGEMMVNILPSSPFILVERIEIPYLNYLNWIIPIEEMIVILGYWLSAIVVYYVVQVILRWVKIIK